MSIKPDSQITRCVHNSQCSARTHYTNEPKTATKKETTAACKKAPSIVKYSWERLAQQTQPSTPPTRMRIRRSSRHDCTKWFSKHCIQPADRKPPEMRRRNASTSIEAPQRFARRQQNSSAPNRPTRPSSLVRQHIGQLATQRRRVKMKTRRGGASTGGYERIKTPLLYMLKRRCRTRRRHRSASRTPHTESDTTTARRAANDDEQQTTTTTAARFT